MARTPAATVKLKQAQALELLAQGYSYQRIADDLGYANRGSAWRLVQNALIAKVDERAETYLRLEIERTEQVMRSLMPLATTGLDPKAADVVLQLIDTQCRLYGLYGDIRGRRPMHLEPEPHGIVMSPWERVELHRRELARAEREVAQSGGKTRGYWQPRKATSRK